ncbi:hypothetical protein E2C01_077705 [Portunus trituberculatus]|uniref:Uncharacterized protein n=1 Tax=Portunus trituberculatus TaxID=210409 RepID=A0A5B7IN14_PORTR|nr:hypothetical protein [Portunus trituberculatus]
MLGGRKRDRKGIKPCPALAFLAKTDKDAVWTRQTETVGRSACACLAPTPPTLPPRTTSLVLPALVSINSDSGETATTECERAGATAGVCGAEEAAGVVVWEMALWLS